MKLIIATVAAALLALLTTATQCQAQMTTKFAGGTLRMVTTGASNNIFIEGLGLGHLKATIGGETFEWQGVKHIKIEPGNNSFPTVYALDLQIPGDFSFTGRSCTIVNSVLGRNCNVEATFRIILDDTHVKKNCSLNNNTGFSSTFYPLEEITVYDCIVNGNAKLNCHAGVAVGGSFFSRNLNIELEGNPEFIHLLENSVVGNMTLDGGPGNGYLIQWSPSVVFGKTKLKRFSSISP